jgi:hypothetical protein
VGRFVWAMLRKPRDGGPNWLRVAFTSRELFAASEARSWIYFDITPAQVGQPERSFDYPQLTLGHSTLYVTARLTGADRPNDAAIFRFGMGELESLDPGVIHFHFFIDSDTGDFGGAQRSKDRKCWAAHIRHHPSDFLRAYLWSENSPQITFQDIQIPNWNRDISSRTPDGSNWLSHEWGTITGAWVGPTPVFGWTAGAKPPALPHPYICLAQLEQAGTGLKLKHFYYIWHPRHAWAKPALASNSRDQLGMTCAIGGPNGHVATTVGIVDLGGASAAYDNRTMAQGTRGAERWGDFLSIRNHAENDSRFIATGYTLHDDPSSSPPTIQSRSRYTIFSRQ